MKLLFSTYSCLPCKVSEPSNAWRAINHALDNNHEVWAVIEGSAHKADIIKYLAEHPMPGFHPVFIQLPPFLVRTLHTTVMMDAVYYHQWQQKLLQTAEELHKRIGFDLCHHVTYGRYWSPSGLRNLGIPFVWGPVGAAEFAPRAFVSELPFRDRYFEWLRNSVRSAAKKSRTLRDTARAATIGIGVTHEACAALRDLQVRRVEQLPQAALTDEELAVFDRLPPPPAGPFRAICIGRLLHWKGFHLAIRAFQIFARKNPEAELWIINDGPFRAELERTVADTGGGAQVRFLGRLETFAEVQAKLAQAHVLMHPALHEAFGNVCMEALAAGRPVVCLDIGGPATQTTAETGFIATAKSPGQSVAEMADFLAHIAGNRTLLANISAKARARVREKFTMRMMGAAFETFYHEAVAMHADSDRRF